MDNREIRVDVPGDRVTEFYRMFADWLDRAPNSQAASVAALDPESEDSSGASRRWWQSLRPSERAIWGLWVDASPQMISATTIVHELGLKGPRDIPGILSWSGRKGRKAGFAVHWQFRNDSLSGEPLYGLEDESFAAIVREARSAINQPVVRS